MGTRDTSLFEPRRTGVKIKYDYRKSGRCSNRVSLNQNDFGFVNFTSGKTQRNFMKKFINEKNLTASLILLIAIIVSGCGSSAKLQSNWDYNEIKIDGSPNEWQSGGFIIKDENVSVNFKNDEKFLYMCLMTNDRGKMTQMIRSGFITWFIPESGDSKIFGIKFPMQVSLLDKDERQEFNKELFRPDELQKQFSKMINGANEFQIINNEKFPLNQYSAENNEGIKVKLGYDADRFVYELQVPIESNENFTYKIAARPGEKVKVKFETLESEFGEMPEAGRGRGGFGMGQRTDRMRSGEGPKFTRPEPFNYEVEVTLQNKN